MNIVKLLRKQAQQIADEDHHGWGNTMLEAAIEIEKLRQQSHNKAIQDELLPSGARDGKIPPVPKANVTELGKPQSS